MKSGLVICMMIGLCCAAQCGADDKIYKWRAADGSIIFSDTPPPGNQAEELELPEPTVVSPVPQNQQQDLLRQSEALDKRIEERINKRDEVIKKLAETREQLAQAKEALEQGREPLPGERQHMASGGTRLKQAYFARIEQQEKAIKELEKQISALQDELQTLR